MSKNGVEMKILNRIGSKSTAAPQQLTPVFRRAAMRDMPRILDIFEASFEGQVPANTMLEYRNKTFPAWSKDLRFQFMVASLGEKIVGFAVVDNYFSPGVANLTAIGVDPAVQGQGIGQGLMAEAEKIASRFPQPTLILEVRENNEKAIRFYNRLGFEIVGTLPQYYSWDKMNAYVMRKDISL
jgi:ribosomal-protein-alanine acetyltransferase